MKVDWKSLESALEKSAKKTVGAVAKKHAKETFYGAFVIANAYDGASVKILFNTEAHLAEQSGGDTSDRQRWLAGNFGFSTSLSGGVEDWDDVAEAIEQAVDDDDDDETATTLVETACRAIARAEKTGAFDALKKTKAFVIAVASSPMEPGATALARYKKFRAKM
ncbi:MAG TPA: DUF4303 domain-containing protein [Polyangiaceae bacterium]|jgi:hypothetical protein|nr:DUF4303 domain-containing protein [Polyangiaceae bacterium]